MSIGNFASGFAQGYANVLLGQKQQQHDDEMEQHRQRLNFFTQLAGSPGIDNQGRALLMGDLTNLIGGNKKGPEAQAIFGHIQDMLNNGVPGTSSEKQVKMPGSFNMNVGNADVSEDRLGPVNPLLENVGGNTNPEAQSIVEQQAREDQNSDAVSNYQNQPFNITTQHGPEHVISMLDPNNKRPFFESQESQLARALQQQKAIDTMKTQNDIEQYNMRRTADDAYNKANPKWSFAGGFPNKDGGLSVIEQSNQGGYRVSNPNGVLPKTSQATKFGEYRAAQQQVLALGQKQQSGQTLTPQEQADLTASQGIVNQFDSEFQTRTAQIEKMHNDINVSKWNIEIERQKLDLDWQKWDLTNRQDVEKAADSLRTMKQNATNMYAKASQAESDAAGFTQAATTDPINAGKYGAAAAAKKAEATSLREQADAAQMFIKEKADSLKATYGDSIEVNAGSEGTPYAKGTRGSTTKRGSAPAQGQQKITNGSFEQAVQTVTGKRPN